MTTGAPVLQAHDLTVEYRIGRQWLTVLNHISLTLGADEIHGLVGESGSGKTTLGLALMRYLDANARIVRGRIDLDGQDLAQRTPAQMRRVWGSKLAYVPQNPLAALNPSYTVGEQIAEIPRLHMGMGRAEAAQRAVEMLRRVKIADPDIVAQRYPHQLSGGMRQRVAIAMALITQPRLLVLDEPTTALDVTTQAVILDLFRELIHDNQAAALYVSHDLATVAQLCERVTVLYAGEVMETASVRALYQRPLHPYTAGLLASRPSAHTAHDGHETRLPVIPGVAPSLSERPSGCAFAPRCPIAQAVCHAQKPALEQADDGRLVRCHRWREVAAGLSPLDAPVVEPVAPPPAAHVPQSVLDARGLSKQFREGGLIARLLRRDRAVHAVDAVGLHVNRQSTLGLVGESGSGKTTLARLIVGLESADSGAVELLGLDVPQPIRQRPREALAALRMVIQNPNEALNPYQTVGFAIGRAVHKAMPHLQPYEVRDRVLWLLGSVRLPASHAARLPAELSGGEKQRVAIARAFAAQPALVLLDEPTSSLDVSVQAVVLNLLKDLRAERGVSYLLISHDLDVVAYLAEWMMVMYLGQVVEQGTSAHVTGFPSHPYTEALVSAVPSTDPTRPPSPIRLEGDVPSARDLPTGCRFHTRCPRYLGEVCRTHEPPMRDAGDGHQIRCHIPIEELARLQATSTPPARPS
jgi:peptide/nickel transport system ATP-binding protein